MKVLVFRVWHISVPYHPEVLRAHQNHLCLLARRGDRGFQIDGRETRTETLQTWQARLRECHTCPICQHFPAWFYGNQGHWIPHAAPRRPPVKEFYPTLMVQPNFAGRRRLKSFLLTFVPALIVARNPPHRNPVLWFHPLILMQIQQTLCKKIIDIMTIMHIIAKNYVLYMGWCDMLCPEKEASA